MDIMNDILNFSHEEISDSNSMLFHIKSNLFMDPVYICHRDVTKGYHYDKYKQFILDRLIKVYEDQVQSINNIKIIPVEIKVLDELVNSIIINEPNGDFKIIIDEENLEDFLNEYNEFN